jgi:linoleoyl-CoA desaturase
MRSRVDDYFVERGLSKHANGAMIRKSVILLTVYVGSYALILSGQLALGWMWLLTFVMGVAMAGIGFSICHDALHGAYSADRRVNRALGWIFDAIGANGYMWKVTHNRIHHVYTNVRGCDEDVDVSPLIRLSPYAPHLPIHRWQHFFFPLAYSLSTVFWVFIKDYKYFFKRDLGPFKNIKHPTGEWVFLFVGKLAYYAVMIVLPLVLLPITWWQFLIGFMTLHLTAGLILGVIFQLAHVVEPTEHYSEDEIGPVKRSWMMHQMRSSSDFAPGSRLLSWYLGGINYQVEHHLFPKICHIHYRSISPIVQAVAARHGLPYNSYPTVWQAIASHYRTLKRFGDPAFAAATAGAEARAA